MTPHKLCYLFRIALPHSLKNGTVLFEGLNQMSPGFGLGETPNHADTISEAIQDFLQQPVLDEIGDGLVKINVAFEVLSAISSIKLHLGLSQRSFQFVQHRLWNQRGNLPYNF